MKRNAMIKTEKLKDELESKKDEWILECDQEIKRMEDLMFDKQPADYTKYIEEKKAHKIEMKSTITPNPSHENSNSYDNV